MKEKTTQDSTLSTVTQSLIEEPQYLFALYNQGLFAEMVTRAEVFVKHVPEHGFVWKLLGSALQNLGRQEESLIAMQKSVEFMPNDADSFYNLGVTFSEQGSVHDAEKNFKRALEINPQHISAIYNLASLFNDTGRLTEAVATYQNALIHFPENTKVMSALISTRYTLCSWHSIYEAEEKLSFHFQSQEIALAPFRLLAFRTLSPQQFYRAGQLFSTLRYKSQLTALPLAPKIIHHHKKLRIGYLSADFHSHATVHLMAGVLESRNLEAFDVYLYSYGGELKDASRSRIEKACEVFRNVRELSDVAIAQQIFEDEIDILVDLKGYTLGSRLGIPALRPATVIISWLGYPGTLGHERLADYIIGDAIVTPLEHAPHFSEKLALMPHCYQPNDNTRPIGARPTRTEAGLPENAFVFATFNQAYKITPEMFDIWCRLLTTVPNSVLWLLEPHPSAQENLRGEMQARGVESSRVIFAPKMEQTAHLGRLQLADLAVDTFPYTSHTTASDALWAGVPLVTKMGETFASRVAASILKTMDLAELVTTNDEDYFNVALNLAQNSEKFAAIKQKISAQKQTSPLFDTPLFARDLERLYQTIWAQELKGERKVVVLKPEEKAVKFEFHPQFITDEKKQNQFVILPFVEWTRLLNLLK